MKISEEEFQKIASGLNLARNLIYSTMKDHGIYPSVENMKWIDEALGAAMKLGFKRESDPSDSAKG